MRWGANAKFAKKSKKKAYYLINLKGNQGKLRKDVERFFNEDLKRNIGEDFVTQIETVDADHGRIETRRHTVCSDIGWLRARHNWPGLKSIVKTEYIYEIRGESKTEIRFHISSFVDCAEKMARYIRDQWQVENCLHWVLDVTFRQDDCRIRTGNAAANFTTINHAAINFLKRVPGKKMSMPQKRRSAALDDDYMEAIIRQLCPIGSDFCMAANSASICVMPNHAVGLAASAALLANV